MRLNDSGSSRRSGVVTREIDYSMFEAHIFTSCLKGVKPQAPAPQVTKQQENPKEKTENDVSAPYATRDGTFKVTLKKTEKLSKVGLNVDRSDGQVLHVDAVDGGLIGQWNNDHVNQPDLQVRIGDQITCVNGLSGDPYEMTKRCGSDNVLELTISREQ